MAWYIKTEAFTKKAKNISNEKRKLFLEEHLYWVKAINASGIKISSGYLVDKNQVPGGGGLLIFEATSYKEAQEIIKNDPMILNELVTWELQEWIPIHEGISNKTIEDSL